MVDLITLEEAKTHLRVDNDDDDKDIALKITAASAAVLNYITDKKFIDEDGSLSGDVPADIKSATLIMLGYLYAQRDNNDNGEYTHGMLPMPVTSLLYPYRQLTVS